MAGQYSIGETNPQPVRLSSFERQRRIFVETNMRCGGINSGSCRFDWTKIRSSLSKVYQWGVWNGLSTAWVGDANELLYKYIVFVVVPV